MPDKGPDGAPWPRISIVTPNLNYGIYLECAIRSVLLQGYPDLEYFIIDGGSTDDSVEIIHKYEQWIRWESKPDQGQGNGINKGLQSATGDILAYLNSDDYYELGAFERIACEMDKSRGRLVVAGDIRQVDESEKEIRVWKSRPPLFRSLLFHHRLYLIRGIIVLPCQPSVFWHRQIVDEIGFLREDLKYGLDLEYWLRILARGHQFSYVPQILANYRFHGQSVSNEGWDKFYPEWKQISAEYMRTLTPWKRALKELYWWSVLVPMSLITSPYRVVSFLLGVKRG